MTATASLRQVASRYRSRHGSATLDDLRHLADEFLKQRTLSILDAASVGLAFDLVFSGDRVDISEISPEMTRAWELAYPNVDIQSLADRSPEELGGIISGWKGKLFEVEVERRLNEGEWVGDLHLESDQVAVLAESSTQPGWDLRILDPDGGTADLIQLKATESVSYIHEALSRYPDTPILATHEVAQQTIGDDVLDSGILNEHVTDTVTEGVSDSTDWLGDAVPATALPLSLILVTEAYQVMSGKKSSDQALTSSGDRIAKSAIAATVAAGVSVVATPFVGAIVGFFTRLALGSETHKSAPPLFVEPSLPNMHSTLLTASHAANGIRRYYPVALPPPSSLGKLTMSDQQELLSLVDNNTRLEIESRAQPLAGWLRMMCRKDMEAMSKVDFDRHFGDLLELKTQDWIKRGFPVTGFIDGIGREFDAEYRDLRSNLDQAIAIGTLIKKRWSGPFSKRDARDLMIAKMTNKEKRQYENEVLLRKQLQRCLHEYPSLSRDMQGKYSHSFYPDGRLKPQDPLDD